jgi:RNA polymerase sigma-70 factor (ECF subfamily)
MDAYIESETEGSGDGVSNLRETSAVDYRQSLINHIPDLHRYARSLTFSTDDADELLQNSLERALSRLHLLREDSNLKSWAFTIMHNIYCNWTRKMKRRPDHAPLDETSFAARVEAHQHASAELTITIGMLGQLSDRQREIIILIAIKGVSYREAAEKLDIPLGTVMSRLGRARERLRELVVNPSPATRASELPSLHGDSAGLARRSEILAPPSNGASCSPYPRVQNTLSTIGPGSEIPTGENGDSARPGSFGPRSRIAECHDGETHLFCER